jgi:hypothetical protein
MASGEGEHFTHLEGKPRTRSRPDGLAGEQEAITGPRAGGRARARTSQASSLGRDSDRPPAERVTPSPASSSRGPNSPPLLWHYALEGPVKELQAACYRLRSVLDTWDTLLDQTPAGKRVALLDALEGLVEPGGAWPLVPPSLGVNCARGGRGNPRTVDGGTIVEEREVPRRVIWAVSPSSGLKAWARDSVYT